MTELKTLKDFEYDDIISEDCYPSKTEKVVKSKELRQEAIKWIKDLDKNLQPIPDLQIIGGNHFKRPKQKNRIILGKIEIDCDDKTQEDIKIILKEWIKHFFNITEVDSQ